MKIYHPATPAEAVQLRREQADAVYLAGGTENLRLGSPNAGKDLISLQGLLSDTITVQGDRVVIGPLCTLQALKESEAVPAILREAACFCASMIKRGSATVGGNLGARRQDSYLAAALAAAGAQLHVLTIQGEMDKSVAEYMNSSLRCLILSVTVNKSVQGSVKRFGNTVSGHAAVIAAEADGIYALSVSGSPFTVGTTPNLAAGMTFTDDITGSASYKKYLAEVVFSKER